jgi:hypothetical protein
MSEVSKSVVSLMRLGPLTYADADSVRRMGCPAGTPTPIVVVKLEAGLPGGSGLYGRFSIVRESIREVLRLGQNEYHGKRLGL